MIRKDKMPIHIRGIEYFEMSDFRKGGKIFNLRLNFIYTAINLIKLF
jgi:hypothetical protein